MSSVSVLKIIIWIVVIAATVIMLGTVYIYSAGLKKLFYPIKDLKIIPQIEFKDLLLPHQTPTKFQLRTKEHSSDKNPKNDYISAWHFSDFNSKNKIKKTILFCHGSSGNISHREYIINFCKGYEINLLLFDYRGYGASSSNNSPKMILQDGLLAYDYLASVTESKDIIVWGESLGGAVAGYIASKRQVGKLLLLSTFSSLSDIVAYDKKNNILFRSAARMIPNVMNELSTKNLNISCPTLVAHSRDDEIIPYECAIILFNSIKNDQKVFVEIAGKHAIPILIESDIRQMLEFCEIGNDNQRTEHAKRFISDLKQAALNINNSATEKNVDVKV